MKTLLLDMYGVILKESKGNFLPYTYAHFPPEAYERITPILFNCDGEDYDGRIVNSFEELEALL